MKETSNIEQGMTNVEGELNAAAAFPERTNSANRPWRTSARVSFSFIMISCLELNSWMASA
jgi:hypothetical protein